MSGAEAVFVLQAIGNCIDLLKVVNTVVRKARAFNKDRYEVPRQFRNLQAILGLLHVVLDRVKDRQKLATIEAAHQARLKQIISNCDSAMAGLLKIFKKHHLRDNTRSTSLANLTRAIQAVAGESDLVARREEIQQYIQAITAFTSAFQPTAKEIAHVVTSELDTLVDRRVSEFALHLKEQQRKSSTSHNSNKDLDQSQGHNIHAQTVQFHQNFFTLPNATFDSNMVPNMMTQGQIPPNVSQLNVAQPNLMHRTSMDTMRTAPVHASRPAPGDWSFQEGVASHQFEPSIISHRSHAGPEPDPAYLHPGERLHQSNSGASSTSCSSSTHSSTRVPSIFSDGDKPPFPSPLSDNGQPFGTSNSHIDPLDPNLLALTDANMLIAQGDGHIPGPGHFDIPVANKKAQQSYNRATGKLEAISERNPEIALRKRRGLTHACLGLTKVTKGEDRERHLRNAVRHSEDAHTAAVRYAETIPSDPTTAGVALSKARLDRARVRARQARIAEKPSNARHKGADPNSLTATAMRMEAFRLYEELAASYEVSCITAAEHDIHAEAMLGCGQVAQMLKAAEGVQGLQRWNCEEPGQYFNRANQSIRAANGIHGTPREVAEDLQSTLSRLIKSWNLPAAEPM